LATPLLTVPPERYKTDEVHEVPLTPLAVDLLQSLPRFKDSDWIFTIDGKGSMSSFTRPKKKLDEASGVTDWVLHDLRRTGRTLMDDLEVLDETAERVLGHSQGGIAATYNISRHRKQKTAALVFLQDEILRIVSKPEGNVVRLKAA
jgi:integrase